MDEAWRRLREIVEEACSLPSSERAAFLDRACADDAVLRAEAASLVAAASQGDDFLEVGDAAAAVAVDALGFDAGSPIGPYRILAPISRGGMGTVFEAEGQNPRRRVALKVLARDLAQAEAQRRFRYEVEVLGTLRHPAIAQVYEAGVQVVAGREIPWFAMELVPEARPITRYARDSGLGIEEIIRLFGTVCDAVHHGHRKGVIHRDLKPDNILVDAQGRPKVIDFGVARATDADLGLTTLETEAGRIVGTLWYMAPEQLSGDRAAIDVRTDVHALGLVLYELLSGRRPYRLEGVPLHEAARIIAEDPPERPGKLTPALAGDLETILLTALAKDPERRYGSVSALARDLERFLAHEPLAARPPSFAYHLRLFTRRHRILVIAALMVFAMAIAAVAVSLRFAWEARRQESAARTRGTELARERDRSAELFGLLLDDSTSATFRFARRLAQLEGATALREEMLRETLGHLDHLASMAPEDLEIRTLQAEAGLELGRVLGAFSGPNLGRDAEARAVCEGALEIGESLARERPDDPRLALLPVRILIVLADIAQRAENLEEAQRRLATARDLLAKLIAGRPAEPRYLREQLIVLDRLAMTAGLSGDPDAAGALFAERHALLQELIARRPKDLELRQQLAVSHGRLGAHALAANRLDAAASCFEEAVTLARRVHEEEPTAGPYRNTIAENLCLLARTRNGQHDLPAAEAAIVEAIAIWKAMAATDPQNTHFQVTLADAHFIYGLTRQQQAAESPSDEQARGMWSEAAALFEQSLAHFSALEARGRLPGTLAGQRTLIEDAIRRCRQKQRSLEP